MPAMMSGRFLMANKVSGIVIEQDLRRSAKLSVRVN